MALYHFLALSSSVLFFFSACSSVNNSKTLQNIEAAIDNRNLPKLLSFLDKGTSFHEKILLGIGSIQPEELPPICLKKITDKDAANRAAAAFAISQLHQKKPLAKKDEEILLSQLKLESNDTVKSAILMALGTAGSKEALAKVCEFTSTSQDVITAQGIGLSYFFSRGIKSDAAVKKCVDLSLSLPQKNLAFNSPLYALSGVSDRSLLIPYLDTLTTYLSPSYPDEVRSTAVSIYGSLLSPEGFKICYQYAQDSSMKVAMTAIISLQAYAQIPQITQALLKLIPQLFESKNNNIVKNAVVLCFSLPQDSTTQSTISSTLEPLLSHPSHEIRSLVIKPLVLYNPSNSTYQKALEKINAESPKKQAELVIDTTFRKKPYNWAWHEAYSSNPTCILKTTKGDIEIELLLSETPLTVQNFIELANQKYYDSTRFHRVVSNFVVQGGDRKGDGSGNPGYSIKSEFTPRIFYRGVVGMASSGKDTEGSQFFIMTSTHSTLNGRYTPFGIVRSDMKIVENIEQGDVILSMSIKK